MYRLAAAGLCLFAGAGLGLCADAADLPSAGGSLKDELPQLPGIRWNGLYAGVHMGAAWGDMKFSEVHGEHSIFGDSVNTPGPIGGGQIGYNYQLDASWILGVEGDASVANLDGTNTCLAYSGSVPSTNCRADIDALGSLTGRLAYALRDHGRTLLYAKGGLAWAHETSTITIRSYSAAVRNCAGECGARH